MGELIYHNTKISSIRMYEDGSDNHRTKFKPPPPSHHLPSTTSHSPPPYFFNSHSTIDHETTTVLQSRNIQSKVTTTPNSLPQNHNYSFTFTLFTQTFIQKHSRQPTLYLILSTLSSMYPAHNLPFQTRRALLQPPLPPN